MAKNSFKANEPYPVTAPGTGRGVQKDYWTRQQPSRGIRLMTSREARRRNPERVRQTDNPLIRQLIGVGGPRMGKTGAQMHPPYGIHSSKPQVRKAIKVWRKGLLKQNAEESTDAQ